MSNDDHRFEVMDWFDISLDDIQDSDDFEMAMEMAHVSGFEDGQLEAEEHNYTDAIYEGIAQERERIIKLLEELTYIDEDGHEMIGEFKTDLIALIRGKNND